MILPDALRPVAVAVRGLGVIILLSAVTPWVLMPHEADWGGLGFGTVVAVALAMVGLGGAWLLTAMAGRSSRSGGAASQMALVLPRAPRRRP